MTLPGSVVYDWCEEQMTGQGKVNTNSAATWESYATWRNYDVSPRCLLVCPIPALNLFFCSS